MLTLSPENQILICVARRSLNSETTARLRELLQRELDWEYLLRAADHHRLIPLLHSHLSVEAQASIPKHVMSTLLDANQKNTRCGLSLTGELIKVMGFFEANEVPVITFKGPTLALQAHGDIGLRQFTDLDVLVHRRDFLRVKQLLVSRGYQPTAELTDAQQAASLRFDCARNFDNEQGMAVDVHWDFVEQYLAFDIDADRLWERAEAVSIGGNQVLSLSAEDHLLILCIHGFTHLWERLGWICDVACLIHGRKDLDWERVLQNATRLGARRILLLGIFLAVDLLDAQLPEEVLKAIEAEPQVRVFGKKLEEQVFAAPVGFFEWVQIQFNMRERKRDKLRLSFSLPATPRNFDWMFLSLPDYLSFLYYPLRPLRLAGKYAAKLVKP